MAEEQYYSEPQGVKGAVKKFADWFPLPVHYILNGAVLLYWFLDMIPWLQMPGGDPLPVADEVLKTILVYYYEVYLLKRTYGVINPMRILKGQTPAAKKKIGMLPYEQTMDYVRRLIKRMGKAAKNAEVPGLSGDKIKKLAGEVAAIEKRLHVLDKTLASKPFQEGPIRAEIKRLTDLMAAADDEKLQEDLKQAVAHAESHIENIGRLRDERNRLVVKLDRFRLELDETWSRLVALAGDAAGPDSADRMLNELFASVKTFDDTLAELEKKPSPELMQKTIDEIERTEAMAQGRIAPKQTTAAK